MGTAPRPRRWRTSSFSSNGSNCVEVSLDPTSNDLAAVKDAKNPGGPTLRVNLRGFLTAVQDGRLDR